RRVASSSVIIGTLPYEVQHAHRRTCAGLVELESLTPCVRRSRFSRTQALTNLPALGRWKLSKRPAQQRQHLNEVLGACATNPVVEQLSQPIVVDEHGTAAREESFDPAGRYRWRVTRRERQRQS